MNSLLNICPRFLILTNKFGLKYVHVLIDSIVNELSQLSLP